MAYKDTYLLNVIKFKGYLSMVQRGRCRVTSSNSWLDQNWCIGHLQSAKIRRKRKLLDPLYTQKTAATFEHRWIDHFDQILSWKWLLLISYHPYHIVHMIWTIRDESPMTQSFWLLSGTAIQILFYILEDGPIWSSKPVYETDFSVKYWPIAKTSSQYWNYNFEIKLGETNGSIKIQFCELYAVPNLGVTKFY